MSQRELMLIKIIVKKIIPSSYIHKILPYYGIAKGYFKMARSTKFTSLITPTQLVLELTNNCNADCIFCPQPEIMKRLKGRMSDEVFNKIIDIVRNYNIKSVMLGGMGEPFLDKKIFNKSKHLSQLGVKVDVTTNGSLIMRHSPKDIVESGLNLISVSMDAINDEYLHQIKPGIKTSVSKIESALANLHEYKKQNKTKLPIVLLRYQIDSKSNIDDKENEIDIIKSKNNICDEVVIRKPHDWLGDLDLGEDYIKQEQTIENICNFYTNNLMIDWNGDCPLCCMDYDATIILGNIMKDSIESIFNNPALAKARRMFMEKNAHTHPLCKGCYSK